MNYKEFCELQKTSECAVGAGLKPARCGEEVLILPFFCRDYEGAKFMRKQEKTSWNIKVLR